jgi:hypothetical protein
MAIALGHDYTGVTQYLLYLIETAARVDQEAGKAVAKIMHAYI